MSEKLESNKKDRARDVEALEMAKNKVEELKRTKEVQRFFCSKRKLLIESTDLGKFKQMDETSRSNLNIE